MADADKDGSAHLPDDAHFEEPHGDDSKCSGRPGCKSNRVSQGEDRWICDTCRRG